MSRRRGGAVSTRAARAIVVVSVIVVGLLMYPATAQTERPNCGFHAEAVVGPAELLGGTGAAPGADPEELSSELSAGCSTSFQCSGSCTLDFFYGVGGLGLLSGEAIVMDSQFRVVARDTCGPTALGCGGQFEFESSGGGFFVVFCRATGVAAVDVDGGCQGNPSF
jgi:hypothetical protein